MQSDQVREFKQPRDENARLKKLVGELSLDKAILQDVATKTGAWVQGILAPTGGIRPAGR